jgi:hypothetical protein
MLYKSAQPVERTADLNSCTLEAIVGSEVKIVDKTAAEIGRTLLLLEAGDLDAAHNKVLSKKRGTANDVDSYYVHALIHRMEGDALGDPPFNIQGYANSNYWLAQCAEAGVHPVWARLTSDKLFFQLKNHPEYIKHTGSGVTEPLTDMSRCLEGGWDPYAFTLTCESCHAALQKKHENGNNDVEKLHMLLQKLQLRETQLLAEHLLQRATGNKPVFAALAKAVTATGNKL